jgi:hypothetical protein
MVFLVLVSTILALKQKFTEIKIIRLNKEIFKNYEELQSLKAQWHYLNNKEYLQALSKKYIPDLVKEIKQSDASLLQKRANPKVEQ